jgi:methylamine dehydrogenase accessory protein MauD
MLTLWIVVIVLGVLELFETVVLVLLLRMLGQMKQQGKLFSALPEQRSGLDVGEHAPLFIVTGHNNNAIRLEDVRGLKSVIVFVSPGCSACAGAIDALNTFKREDHDMALLVIGAASERQNHTFAFEYQAQMPILAADLSLALDSYRIPGFPFVYVLDEEQIIRARGAVNCYEHLQALLTTAFGPSLSHNQAS